MIHIEHFKNRLIEAGFKIEESPLGRYDIFSAYRNFKSIHTCLTNGRNQICFNVYGKYVDEYYRVEAKITGEIQENCWYNNSLYALSPEFVCENIEKIVTVLVKSWEAACESASSIAFKNT